MVSILNSPSLQKKHKINPIKLFLQFANCNCKKIRCLQPKLLAIHRHENLNIKVLFAKQISHLEEGTIFANVISENIDKHDVN